MEIKTDGANGLKKDMRVRQRERQTWFVHCTASVLAAWEFRKGSDAVRGRIGRVVGMEVMAAFSNAGCRDQCNLQYHRLWVLSRQSDGCRLRVREPTKEGQATQQILSSGQRKTAYAYKERYLVPKFSYCHIVANTNQANCCLE